MTKKESTSGVNHSDLAKVAFLLFLFPTFFCALFWFNNFTKTLENGLFYLYSTIWILMYPTSIIISAIDLAKPDRLRVLPKITIILSITFSCFIIVSLIMSIGYYAIRKDGGI